MTRMKELSPFGLRIPPEIKEWIEAQSKKDRMSMNSFVLRLIEKAKESHHAAS